ncbi:MAG: SUMF1/EgtB/PvdO family nonheme iron enzyme [Desulfobacterales bacterium]|nr:SUMF1/EgtB/PvdO family nonheme iron enzyme [Desulfobacterales bacterium]
MKKIFASICMLLYLSLFAGICNSEPAKIINKKDLNHSNDKLGTFYGLFIGINTYNDSNIEALKTSVKDAETFAQILQKKYKFKTTLLLNDKATKDNIIKNLESFQKSIKENDSLLIYFSGYGKIDRLYDLGWWLPYDAINNNSSSFIDNSFFNQIISSINARHILVISDACYSEIHLSPSISLPSSKNDQFYIDIFNKKSRCALVSRLNSPEISPQIKNYSIFANELINIFDSAKEGILITSEILSIISPEIKKKSNNIPILGQIRGTGSQDGEFTFVFYNQDRTQDRIQEETQNQLNPPEISKDNKVTLNVNCNVSGATIILNDANIGNLPLKNYPITDGNHIIIVKKEGYETFKQEIKIVKNSNPSPIMVELQKKIENGKLFIEYSPKTAKIQIAGVNKNFSQGMELKAGKYQIEVSNALYEKKETSVDIIAGKDSKIQLNLNLMEKFKNSLGMEFILIQPGTFVMGSPESEQNREDDEFKHEVTLSNKFYMQKTEVTVGQWKKFIEETKYKTTAEVEGDSLIKFTKKDASWKKEKGYYWNKPGFNQTDDHPVTCVSYFDVIEFITWLNKNENIQYSLPTEAEWEYSCRSGTSTAYSYGNCLTTDQANYDGNYPLKGCSKGKYNKSPLRVGSLIPNKWGLHDMHGNVWEWCMDWLGDYPKTKSVDPTGPSSGTERIYRGGGWDSYARICRSANRLSRLPDYRSSEVGFRLAIKP